MGINLQNTISCYAPQGDKACMHCLSCQLRQAAIDEVNKSG